MSPTELTDLHKSKLLEMCDNLFTEYRQISIYNLDTDISEDNDIQTINFWDGINCGKSIHWFEFCMTKLWIRINSLVSKHTPEELMSMYWAYWDITNEKLHPIDYLYEQFKNLKQ